MGQSLDDVGIYQHFFQSHFFSRLYKILAKEQCNYAMHIIQIWA